jgi:acyl-CoA dehydrogenase
MADTDSLVVEAAERLLGDLCDPQTVNNAMDDGWKERLWQALAENGLIHASIPEELGGSGAEPSDGFKLVRLAGRFAVPVPLAETMLAGWLLSKGNLAAPEGRMSIAPVQPADTITLKDDGTLAGRARAVPFAREAPHFAIFATGPAGPAVALVAASDCRREEDENLAGEPLDDLVFETTRPLATAPLPADFSQQDFMLMGCVVRSLQIAGALQDMLTRSVAYSQERVAFEKKISKFQAVQHNLARLAGETAAAIAAAGSAADTLSSGTAEADAVFLEATAAKIRCAEAASTGAAIAHQVHGAIGFTTEYVLHRFSLRAWGWRDDFGNESYWAVELGKMLARRGADDLWPLVASR